MNSSPGIAQWNNRALFRLLWPLVLEQLLAFAMGAADTGIVSYVGEAAVSGVNIIDQINQLLVIAFTALATGGAVVCSQYIGRRDFKNAGHAARQLIYIVTVVSLVITFIALAFRRRLISLIYGKIDSGVMDAAMIYFLLTALSFPMLALYNVAAALFRSTGNSKISMFIALFANILNIGGNVLFVYRLDMGVAGVGISTVLCRAFAVVFIFVMLVRDKKIPVSVKGILKIKFDSSMARRLLNIGIPTGLESSMFQIGKLLTQRIFPVFGTSVMAANAVASIVNSVSYMPGLAFGMAILTVVGQCIGMGDYEAAKRHTRKMLTINWILIFIISGVTFVLRGTLINLFGLGPDAAVTAKEFLSVHCVSMLLFWTFSFSLPNALRAAGDAKFVMIAAAVSMWTIRVFFAYVLVFTLNLGPVGVWYAMGGDFVLRAACYFLRWRGGRWQTMKVIDN